MIDIPPSEIHHTVSEAPPAGSSINQIIDHYWRQMCINEGIDPDNLPAGKQENNERYCFLCEEGPNGTFQAVRIPSLEVNLLAPEEEQAP